MFRHFASKSCFFDRGGGVNRIWIFRMNAVERHTSKTLSLIKHQPKGNLLRSGKNPAGAPNLAFAACSVRARAWISCPQATHNTSFYNTRTHTHTPKRASCLSGPLRLRVQSRSRTRLRIAVSIAFLFRTSFKEVLDTIAPLSRG